MDPITDGIGTHLSPMDAEVLRATAKWARFLAIIGFVMILLMVLFGLFAGTLIGKLVARESAMNGMPVPKAVGMLGVVYAVISFGIALLYWFPVMHLYRFAGGTLKALKGPFDSAAFSKAMVALRKLFTYVGVLSIIVICLYALGILFVGVSALLVR